METPALRVFSPSEPDEGQLVFTPELQAELASWSRKLESATPQEILRWAVERYAPRFTMATAFGPEGMVLIHMLAEFAPATPIFNLDTGYQFAETLALRERVLERYGVAVEMRRPEQSVAEYEAAHGGPVYKANPDKCCADRKLSVLTQSVVGMHAWASAIRRDQSPDRAQAPIVGWDRKFGLVKVSPLANWTKKQVWKMIVDHDIPYNPLHDQGYPSIGCWPCTRSVMFGEDERAGRWSGFKKTECGLHSIDSPAGPSDAATSETAAETAAETATETAAETAAETTADSSARSRHEKS
jgi:phosphoadenosine phosphosulfate reductase